MEHGAGEFLDLLFEFHEVVGWTVARHLFPDVEFSLAGDFKQFIDVEMRTEDAFTAVSELFARAMLHAGDAELESGLDDFAFGHVRAEPPFTGVLGFDLARVNVGFSVRGLDEEVLF